MTEKSFSDFLMLLGDPNMDKSLEDIPVFAERIFSLIVRNKHKVENLYDYTKIKGSLSFLEGIEYHYKNFISHLDALALLDSVEENSMLGHEAVAYLHRLGQFWYFARSFQLLQVCPKIDELFLFRKKSVGHRSIDAPRSEEDKNPEQIWQAGCFERILFSGKLEPDFDYHRDMQKYKDDFKTPKKYLHEKMNISYQILSNGKYADFTPQKDHPVILKEIEEAYSKLFLSRQNI